MSEQTGTAGQSEATTSNKRHNLIRRVMACDCRLTPPQKYKRRGLPPASPLKNTPLIPPFSSKFVLYRITSDIVRCLPDRRCKEQTTYTSDRHTVVESDRRTGYCARNSLLQNEDSVEDTTVDASHTVLAIMGHNRRTHRAAYSGSSRGKAVCNGNFGGLVGKCWFLVFLSLLYHIINRSNVAICTVAF